MSYRVFARKYRPQKFEEVVGQEHITRTLQNAIANKRLAQAYLFVGPRGIGKTSTARILAKGLNCATGPTTNPCGTCDPCREIAEGNSLDVLEIDGASNNSVESVRELRENAAYAPARGPFKIYLIDEVHMLSTAAFNALLKTLEEPPPHVKFIFATTEAQKVPATITSRCQRFDLRRIPAPLIASHLQAISENEGIVLDDDAAALVARGADGGLRDAESMLDQLVAFCGNHITGEDVLVVFGFTSRETVTSLTERLFAMDAPGALAIAEAQAEAGRDLSRLMADLIGYLRDLLVEKVRPGADSENPSIGAAISREKLLTLLDHFAESEGRLRWVSDKRLHLDIAIIKAVHILDQTSLTDVIETLTAIGSGGELPARPAAVPESTSVISAPSPVAPEPVKRVPLPQPVADVPVAVPRPETKAAVPEAKPPAVPENQPVKPLDPVTPEPIAVSPAPIDASGAWRETAALLAKESIIRFGWLERGQFDACDEAEFRVRFPASFESNTEGLFWLELRKKVEMHLTTRLGRKVVWKPEFSTDLADPVEYEPEPVEERFAEAAPPEEKPSPARDPMEEFKDDPFIRKAIEVFKARRETAES